MIYNLLIGGAAGRGMCSNGTKTAMAMANT